MKKAVIFLGAVMLSAGAFSLAQHQQRFHSESQHGKETMESNTNVKVILEIFRAIEKRDEKRAAELFDPEFEIHWPPSLPYGGSWRGQTHGGATWGSTWAPLQPTEAERKMDARVVAASGEDVVVLWRQRGLAAAGDRFDGEVLGMYRVKNGKLVRAQMFYFDTAAVAAFLSKANSQRTAAH